MRLKVLIIEDEKMIGDIIKAYLEREGYQVTLAATGQEGLGLVRESPDLIILDLMLPDMDGEDICRAIRASHDMPIIMLTAKSREDDRVQGLLMGADDYVVKPFSPRELIARVKARLRRRDGRPLSFNKGSLVINKTTMEVRKEGSAVSLTTTEFKLLLVLCENRGHVLSRLQLINHVQGYDFEGYERTIDAHIKNIRHKIEPSLIKTMYGAGYKFTGTPDED